MTAAAPKIMQPRHDGHKWHVSGLENKKLTSALWETHVPRYNRGPIEDTPLNPSITYCIVMYGGPQYCPHDDESCQFLVVVFAVWRVRSPRRPREAEVDPREWGKHVCVCVCPWYAPSRDIFRKRCCWYWWVGISSKNVALFWLLFYLLRTWRLNNYFMPPCSY